MNDYFLGKKYVYEKNLDDFIYLHNIFISSYAILTTLLCFMIMIYLQITSIPSQTKSHISLYYTISKGMIFPTSLPKHIYSVV